MQFDLEKSIDEIASRIQKGREVSSWEKDPRFASITKIFTTLARLPKAKIPVANFERVKNQVLDRIALPKEIANEKTGMFAAIPNLVKLAAGMLGTLLIVVSLGIGTAVAALQSTPGQTIYPLKKVVENVELALTRDPAARANLQIQFANDRLEELSTVIAQSNAGVISAQDAQRIVSQTVSDLQKTTAAASSTANKSADNKQNAAVLNKLVDLSNKQTAVLKPLLSAANISSDGQVKIVLQQALATSQTSKEQAIKNIENAGLKIEDQPISIDATPSDPQNTVSANGKITELTTESVSIGTSKFLVTKDTKYDSIKSADLKVGIAVQITGIVKDGKTLAQTISSDSTDAIIPPAASTDTQSNTDNPAP